jgi:hypothetical protein
MTDTGGAYRGRQYQWLGSDGHVKAYRGFESLLFRRV